MTGKTFSCVACEEKKIPIGKWLGCFGDPSQEHKVEPKTYYTEHDSLQVSVIPEHRMMVEGGNLLFIPGVSAGFVGGQYTTDSPEIQHVLDQKPYMQTKDQYIDQRLAPKDREGRLKATVVEQANLLKSQQAELEQLRAAKGAGAAVAVEEKPEEDGEAKPQEPTKRAARGRG